MPEKRDDNRPEEAATTPPGNDAAPAGAAAAGAGTEAAGEAPPGDAERLAAAEAQISQLKEDYLRALAEVENVRRRALRDKQDASQYAITGFARDLLSVADNLRRALDAVDTASREKDPALDTLTNGVELTEKELLSIFARHGITPIQALGEPFDPHVHEAVFQVPDDSVPTGTVVQELQTGYKLKDRTLRPTTVGVSRGGPKPGAPTPDGDETPAPEAGDLSSGTDDENASASRSAGGAYGRSGANAAAGGRIDETL